MTLPRALGKFNRYATNQVAGLVAGRAPGFGIVVHRGRKSGRVYRTPVTVFERDGGYRIALTYGTGVDWLKNVLAAGDFELEVRGKVVEMTNPVVHHDPSAGWAPAPVRLVLQTISATDYVQAQPA